MKNLAFALLLWLVVNCDSVTAQLVHAWVDLEDKIVISSIGEPHPELLGLDVKSPGGFLSAESAHPFMITLLDTPGNVVVGNLGTAFTLDKPTVTGLRFDFEAAALSGTNFCEDVSTTWGALVFPSPALPGDANLDGKVSFEDFLVLSTNFTKVGTWPDGDFDCDRMVGFTDFLLMSTNFGMEQDLRPPVVVPPFFPVPEPTGLLIATVTVIGLWIGRTRRRR